MRVKLFIVALFATFVAGNLFAQGTLDVTHVVYKTTNKVEIYDQGTEKKATKMKIETYAVFSAEKLEGEADAEDPVRIVILKLNKVNKGWEAETDEGKNTKKLFIDPSSFNYNDDGTIKDYGPYEDDDVYDDLKPYLPYAGPWTCEASRTNYWQFILDYLDTEEAGGVNAEKRGEAYTGKMKDDKNYGWVSKSLKGNMSYYTTEDAPATDWEIGLDSKGKLKLDKKTTEAADGSDDIWDAVAAVNAYLVSKKYASTFG